jgi:hypothetical protein
LVDRGSPTWSSWNRFAQEFAADVGAHVADIDDGGITGDAFYAHVRRLRTPVLESPKRHSLPTPPRLGRCQVTNPVPAWTWSLLHRADDDRPTVGQVAESLVAYAESRNWRTAPASRWWLPALDPHHSVLRR